MGRSIQPYLAPHGALSLNFGLANVLVAPGERVGGPAIANLEPPSRALRLQAKVKTSRGRRLRIRLGRRRSKGKDVVQVSGWFPAGNRMKRYRVPVTDPTAFTAGAVAAELERQGIAFKGGIRRAATPPEARLLARNLSPPLSEVVRGLNKFSNNFVAEQVLKTMGAETHGAPGTAEKGLARRAGFSDLHRRLGEGDRPRRRFGLEQNEPRLAARSGDPARSGAQRFQAAARVHGVAGRVRRGRDGGRKDAAAESIRAGCV